jgi:hypothetical protein
MQARSKRARRGPSTLLEEKANAEQRSVVAP